MEKTSLMQSMTMVAKNAKRSESGQAIFEFIIFVPFLLMVYVMILDIGNAINASINQQKAARGYFFARTKWNSTMPKSRYENGGPSGFYQGFSELISFDFIGWKERMEGQSIPVAPCFRLRLPMSAGSEPECGEYSDPSTQWIRVQTVFGVCGASILRNPNGLARLEFNTLENMSNLLSCTNQ